MKRPHKDSLNNNPVFLQLCVVNKKSATSAQVFLFLLFCSGVIGSGLAIFSKYRIHDTFLYRYSLNGYPYMVRLRSLRFNT